MKSYGINTRNTMSKEFINDNLDLILSLIKMDTRNDKFLNISVDDIRNLTFKEIVLKYNLNERDANTLKVIFINNKIKYNNLLNTYDYSGIDFDNKTLREISDKTGVPYGSLFRFCKNNNIEFKHCYVGCKPMPSKYDFSDIDFKNKTLKEISKETGIQYDCLLRYCYKNGIEFKRSVSKRRDYSGIDFKNKTIPEISKETGIPYAYLIQYCKKNGIEFKRSVSKHHDYSGLDFKNKTLREISEETGFEIEALRHYCWSRKISYKFSELGLPKYDYSGIDFKNKTLKEISKETGIPYWSLNDYCHNNNIEFKQQRKRKLSKKNT